MASEPTRQICGNCGAPNDPDAVTCIVCGAVLSAYAQSQTPATTTTTTTQAPATTPAPPAALTTATDWRSMFESKTVSDSDIPEPPTYLDLDFSDTALTTTTSTTSVPATTTPAPRTTVPPVTTRPPQPRAQTRDRATTTARPVRARPAPWQRPVSEPRFNRRRPQTFVTLGVLLLLLGCLGSGMLALAGVSDVAVGLVFLCLTPLGLIAIVAAVVVAISRKEGRG